jgi:hypothetical protein
MNKYNILYISDYNLVKNIREINKRTHLGNLYFENIYIIIPSNIKVYTT